MRIAPGAMLPIASPPCPASFTEAPWLPSFYRESKAEFLCLLAPEVTQPMRCEVVGETEPFLTTDLCRSFCMRGFHKGNALIHGRSGLETFAILVQEEALSKRECHQKSPSRCVIA